MPPELAIDERCAYILARRQPAASDLRLVLAVVKMLADVERIGDEAKRIAKLAERLVGEEGGTDVTASLAELGALARGQLRGALDAFARLDETLALDVMRRDKQLDDVYKNLFTVLVERMQHAPAQIPVELDRLWCARSFERIGDRCKNLCEYVLYLVRGKDVRHSGLAKGEPGSGEERSRSPRVDAAKLVLSVAGLRFAANRLAVRDDDLVSPPRRCAT